MTYHRMLARERHSKLARLLAQDNARMFSALREVYRARPPLWGESKSDPVPRPMTSAELDGRERIGKSVLWWISDGD